MFHLYSRYEGDSHFRPRSNDALISQVLDLMQMSGNDRFFLAFSEADLTYGPYLFFLLSDRAEVRSYSNQQTQPSQLGSFEQAMSPVREFISNIHNVIDIRCLKKELMECKKTLKAKERELDLNIQRYRLLHKASIACMNRVKTLKPPQPELLH